MTQAIGMNAINYLVLLSYCKNVAQLVIAAIPEMIWVTNTATGMAWVSLWNATSLCEGTNEILNVCPKLASLNHCSAVIQFEVPRGADSSSDITLYHHSSSEASSGTWLGCTVNGNQIYLCRSQVFQMGSNFEIKDVVLFLLCKKAVFYP